MSSTLNKDWQDVVECAYGSLDETYRTFLEQDKDYFPDVSNYLNAFKTLPRRHVKYILFGQ